MTRPFEIGVPEKGYERRALFAIKLLDSVTLEPVSQGVKVSAEGLKGEPTVNASGMFVWLDQEIANLRKVSIDPGILPYEQLDVERADLRLPPDPRPLTTIALPPRIDYPFAPGLTGARGSLIETRVNPTPVGNAEVGLRWLDDNGTWRDAPTRSRTGAANGDFVSILSLAPTDVPDIDPDGKLTVRVRVRRDTTERSSAELKLLQGRVADPATLSALTFAWDELQA
jgi:hypothetical protein